METLSIQDASESHRPIETSMQADSQTVYALYWSLDRVYAVDHTTTGILMLTFSTLIAAKAHIRDNAMFLASEYGYAPEPVAKDLSSPLMPRFISRDGKCVDRWNLVDTPQLEEAA